MKNYTKKYGYKIIIEQGKKFVYAVLNQALYGAIISSLLFCRDLVRKLKSWVFQPNPYYPCVMNKVIDRKSCAVCWHMSSLKISHMESTVAYNVLRRLE